MFFLFDCHTLEGLHQQVDLEAVTQYRCSNKHFPKARKKPGGGTPYSGLYGEAPPERGQGVPFFKLVVCKKVRKIVILVYERVTKSAAKWKKWWLKRSISKGATFWQK